MQAFMVYKLWYLAILQYFLCERVLVEWQWSPCDVSGQPCSGGGGGGPICQCI